MTPDRPVSDNARVDALRKAADDGDADAMHRLGMALVSRNASDEAFALQLRAAETGHVDAQIYLARMLLYGIVAAPEPGEAVQWLLRAERAGSAIAGYHLASIALGGLALPRDARINERLHAAMRAEYAPALRAVAIHFGRKADDNDQTLCVQLLERAAHAGDAIAAALLTERLANGEGVDAAPTAAAELRAQLDARGIAPLPVLRMPLPQQGTLLRRELAIEEALHAPPSQQLTDSPRVSVVDGLLSADECRLLIAATRPELRESRTVDPDTGQPISMQIRTSSDTSLDPLR
ncbi:MAG: 2OG-Fe(II) oxygenase, partial [Luteimonas sp.]